MKNPLDSMTGTVVARCRHYHSSGPHRRRCAWRHVRQNQPGFAHTCLIIWAGMFGLRKPSLIALSSPDGAAQLAPCTHGAPGMYSVPRFGASPRVRGLEAV